MVANAAQQEQPPTVGSLVRTFKKMYREYGVGLQRISFSFSLSDGDGELKSSRWPCRLRTGGTALSRFDERAPNSLEYGCALGAKNQKK